jgi:hypothetical protein
MKSYIASEQGVILNKMDEVQELYQEVLTDDQIEKAIADSLKTEAGIFTIKDAPHPYPSELI